MSGCGRLGSCSSRGVDSTGGEWNSVPVRRTKHLWWVRPKWLYAKPAVRVTHERDLIPRGSQRSRTAPGFATFPQRLLFREVFPSEKWFIRQLIGHRSHASENPRRVRHTRLWDQPASLSRKWLRNSNAPRNSSVPHRPAIQRGGLTNKSCPVRAGADCQT